MGEREYAMEQLFRKCANHYGIPEIQNMPYNTQDRGCNDNTNMYTMCYHKSHPEQKSICGPDWVTHSWPSASVPSFRDTVNSIIEKSNNTPTIHKVGWYGNLYSAGNDVIEHYTRPLLKQIGDNNRHMFDIVYIEGHRISRDNINYLSIPDLTRYSVLIDLGGGGYSGRLKFLLFTKRPLLLVDRNYIEYFYDDLIPYVHFIPVKMDLSDLLEKTTWVFNNYDTCKKIAENAFEFATRYFSEENINKRIYDVYLELSQRNDNS